MTSAKTSAKSAEYLRPRSLAEAVEMRAAHPASSGWMVLAGGTDLLVSASHKAEPPGILDLWRLPDLGGIRRERAVRIADKGSERDLPDRIVLGAGVTWLEVQRSPLILQHIAILADAAREIGALQIQARGTVGGNIANSSPVGDSLPVFLALEAELELCSVRGTRFLPYHQFCTGYRKTELAADELLVAVHVPMPAHNTKLLWRKVGTRRAQSISKVMGAAAICVEGEGEAALIKRACVALSAVADRPIRVTAVEEAVAGLAWSKAAEAARAAVSKAITPISDLRSTKEYRVQVAENLVARFFT